MALKFLNLSLKILLIFIIFLIFYIPNYFRLISLKRANLQLKGEMDNLKKDIKILEEKKKKLNKDISYEEFVRENLGFIRENEIVIDIEE